MIYWKRLHFYVKSFLIKTVCKYFLCARENEKVMCMRPNFSLIKKLLENNSIVKVQPVMYQDVTRQKTIAAAIFGLPSTTVVNLAEIFKRQLFLFAQNDIGKKFPISFAKYANTVYTIVNLGYIATSSVACNKDLLSYYYTSVETAFVKHGDFSVNLDLDAVAEIADHLARIINIALVAFNLTNYPAQFIEFKNALVTVLQSLDMLTQEDDLLKEIKKLLRRIIEN
jgi:hypothetical protein